MTIRWGVTLPQTEIGSDPDGIRRYIDAAVSAGYDHVLVYDHVVGADISNRPDWPGPYTYHHQFHEPFTLFGFLAAICQLELVTGILILPQRQAVLVAKQAAEADLLSKGRLRLGVGIGWNTVEYESLGMDFRTKARRMEEQIHVMRELWTKELVNFVSADHRIVDAGIAPLPVQRPIPVWLSGGPIEPVIDRVARIGDGWMPLGVPTHRLGEAFAEIKERAERLGRDPRSIGMQGIQSIVGPEAGRVAELAERWATAGATHVSVNTLNAGIGGVDEHIDVIVSAARTLGISA